MAFLTHYFLPVFGLFGPPLVPLAGLVGLEGDVRDDDEKHLNRKYPPAVRNISRKISPKMKSIFLDFPLPLWFSFSAMSSNMYSVLYFSF